jgi:hypothetical protein
MQQQKGTQVRFDGQHVHVGIDLARKSWKVCIYVGQSYHKRFSQVPDPQALVAYLHRNVPGAIYHTVYGRLFSFWIHRALTSLGASMVSIGRPDDRQRAHTKTDRIDAASAGPRHGRARAIYV